MFQGDYICNLRSVRPQSLFGPGPTYMLDFIPIRGHVQLNIQNSLQISEHENKYTASNKFKNLLIV